MLTTSVYLREFTSAYYEIQQCMAPTPEIYFMMCYSITFKNLKGQLYYIYMMNL